MFQTAHFSVISCKARRYVGNNPANHSIKCANRLPDAGNQAGSDESVSYRRICMARIFREQPLHNLLYRRRCNRQKCGYTHAGYRPGVHRLRQNGALSFGICVTYPQNEMGESVRLFSTQDPCRNFSRFIRGSS